MAHASEEMIVDGGDGRHQQHACLQAPMQFQAFNLVERLPPPSQASGEVMLMQHAESGVQCVFKAVCVPMDEADIQKTLVGVKEAWSGGSPHPNVMPLLDCGYDRTSHRFIIATEWMDALSLRDHMRLQPIPEQPVGCVVSQLVKALAHLHKEWHRAHRDLKPGNILLNTQGLVRITDLGQSKQMAHTMGYMGSFVGAQVYMSPQRIQGAQYTSACDVWSLGLIAQECLMGEFPYYPELKRQNLEPSIDVLIEMMEEAPPQALAETFTQNAKDFCSAALTFAEATRPSSMLLMQHPFVVGNQQCDALAAWVQTSVHNIQRNPR